MSLQQMEYKKDQLRKQSAEGVSSNSLTQLVTEEAFTVFTSNFPKLTPFIVGVNIDDKNPTGVILGGTTLIVDGTKFVVPLVYNGTKTITGLMVYLEETDVMLGLTKKLAKKMLETRLGIMGEAQKKKVPFDKGDFKKLFIPPKTFSPKVASSGLIYSALENDLVKEALFDAMDSDPYTRRVLTQHIGQDVIDSIPDMRKEARVLDETEAQVISTMEQLQTSGWVHKEAAARELAQYGVSISVGKDHAKKKLVAIDSPNSILTRQLGVEALETITHDGFYKVFNKAGGTIDYVFASKQDSGLNGSSNSSFRLSGKTATINVRGNVIGVPVSVNEVDFLTYVNRKSFDSLASKSIILLKDGKYLQHLSHISNVSYGISSISFTTSHKGKRTNVTIGLNSEEPVTFSLGDTYIGDSNVRVLSTGCSDEGLLPAVTSDLENDFFSKNYYEATNLIKVKKDHSGSFVYGGKLLQAEGLASILMGQGYDKLSVLTLLKTSATNPDAVFAEINYKMDRLLGVIQNLSGRITKIESSSQPQQEQQGQEAQQPAQQQQQQQGGGLEQQQQAQQQAQAQQQPGQAQIGGFADKASGFAPQQQQPQADPLQEQQQAEQQRQQELQQEQKFQEQMLSQGINPKMDPSVLKTVLDLKDSTVMDVSALTMIAQTSEISEALQSFLPDFQAGVSSMAKILLNLLAREKTIIDAVGDKKYKRTILDLKTMLLKATDIYLEVAAQKDTLEQEL